MSFAFIDLASQQNRIRENIDQKIAAVLNHGQYIMGPEVSELETALSKRVATNHVISCGSGTDALLLALMGLKLKPRQGVIVPSFTFTASAEVMPLLGAIPIFAEVDEETFTMDPARLADALESAIDANIEVVGIMAVGLFGQPAQMDKINAFAKSNGLWVLDDAAQSFGTEYQGSKTGALAEVTCTSFFPAKPLGCYGDGGALFTQDDEIAEIARSCRVHGQGIHKYHTERLGMTARLDTMQAAILLAKLDIFDEELKLREKVAKNYHNLLSDWIKTPVCNQGSTSSWAIYTLTLPKSVDRQHMQEKLNIKGVPTAIYYPIPMHLQKPYSHFPRAKYGLEVSERLAQSVLSIPMHPYLTSQEQETISSAIIQIIKDGNNN
ncbi:DegT/DnrJ/EryC1/StrS aminotransferase family protein [Alphaproteobacteria bacterium]|jgi:dTDP-4-amino-4,6-dideoxygalactose transaminase|nr:DegT/DnrJ/EryC1/StrS aminotransferase family protein [Alphaproteobacteria bacterium]MBT5798348.1 DegT/DnrJ/EryC1/StrS aminotransferase family protein [Alphaproteobacteria bacterium]MDA9815888.1 DegT/DnrJ/EryC1/StrS aminotransferase family protein [Alphaproteobacteria bacterium]MDC0461975.1 DegT/DnrJ/EryC1/StrS aminotransferase family protein [Alphaproteobacteria bacterium]